MNKRKYNTIIFDFGGVIINIDYELTRKAFKTLDINNREVNFSQNEQSDLFDKFEKGQISPKMFRQGIKKHLNIDISDREIDMAWNKMLLDIPPERIDWILKLKEKYQCVLLSNTNAIHYDAFREEFEANYGYEKFSDLFHKTYFSHEIALRKPDANIYNYVLNDLNLKPSEVLFLDDTEKNINAAQKLGWNCILWKNKELDELF